MISLRAIPQTTPIAAAPNPIRNHKRIANIVTSSVRSETRNAAIITLQINATMRMANLLAPKYFFIAFPFAQLHFIAPCHTFGVSSFRATMSICSSLLIRASKSSTAPHSVVARPTCAKPIVPIISACHSAPISYPCVSRVTAWRNRVTILTLCVFITVPFVLVVSVQSTLAYSDCLSNRFLITIPGKRDQTSLKPRPLSCS